MTDTPAAAPTYPPPTLLEQIKGFIGDLARPFAIISTSLAASAATVIIATRVDNGNDGAILMGAVGALVGGLYGFKAVETWKAKKQDADVEIAKATGEVKP